MRRTLMIITVALVLCLCGCSEVPQISDTVEGNSGDSCRQCQRAVGNYEILGYGVLIP